MGIAATNQLVSGDLLLLPPPVEPVVKRLPRILCVDDEVRVLEGLVGRLRHRFEVVTATSGAEGLRALHERGPFAVVVSDMRMPGMNGPKFLNHVRQICPNTVRLALTGYADLNATVAAINDGHVFRFLLKPCTEEMLLGALDDAVDQHRMLTQDRYLMTRKLDELSRQLLLAERRACLGTMAGAIAHELNNMLAVFVCSLRMVKESASMGLVPEKEDLDQLDQVGAHLRQHASSLRHLSRPRPVEVITLDLCKVASETVERLRAIGLLRQALVKLDFPTIPVFVKVDRIAFEQVLINLINNACYATTMVTARAPRLRVSLKVSRRAGRVICSVEDNGCGIPHDQLQTIFDPYYTTKDLEHGTGLGVVVVKQIVEDAGGEIDVLSELGVGSVFTLTLPLAGASQSDTRAL